MLLCMSNVCDCWRLPNSRWQHPHNITHLPGTNYVKSSRTMCGVKCASSCVGFKPGVHTRDCTCLRADWTVASQSGRDRAAYIVPTRSTPSDSLNAADVYAPWCHLVFRHASVMTAVGIDWYLKSGDSRFSWGICWNVSRPGRITVASDAWPSFKARRRWIGAKSLVCTPGFSSSICRVEKKFFLVVCASTFENCTNLFYVNMFNIAQDRIHAQYFNKIIITYCVGRGKKRYGRVCRRLYAQKSSATHELENAVSAYRVSAKQRLENQRLEQPIRKKSYLL